MIHFDTNFLIESFVPGSAAQAKMRSWLSGGDALGISAVVWAELLCGPLSPQDEVLVRQLFPAPEPLLATDAAHAAGLFNQTGRRSRSLADCMIAAVAIRVGARLATNNLPDFTPFQPFGLLLA